MDHSRRSESPKGRPPGKYYVRRSKSHERSNLTEHSTNGSKSRRRSHSAASSSYDGSASGRHSSHSKKRSSDGEEMSKRLQLVEIKRQRCHKYSLKLPHDAAVNKAAEEESELLLEGDKNREGFQCGSSECTLPKELISADHITADNLLNQEKDDGVIGLQPVNVEALECSNLRSVVKFIFAIDEDVASKIYVWKIIEAFDQLFNQDQSGIVCITRPPCWGKTTIINILMLYYSVSFPPNHYPALRCEKIPFEVFHGRQALQYKYKRIKFPESEPNKLKYDDRASQLCLVLDFSFIKGNTLSELAADFKWAVHRTLKCFVHCLSKYQEFEKCTQKTCNESDHLDLLTNALEILSELDVFTTCSKIMFIDEIDYPLIRVQNVAEKVKLRRSLETFIRKVNSLDFKVITFGVFPHICDEIMPNNLAKACSVANASLKQAFGIDKVEEIVSASDSQSLIESANGYTFDGTNKISLFCYTLWRTNQSVYPKDYFKYKSLLLIENKFNENDYFVSLTTQLLKYTVTFVEKTENSLFRNSLNVLFYAGFLVTRQKETLSKEMKANMLLCLEKEEEKDIPDDGIYYVFPNTIMQNSLRLFLGSVLRTKLLTKHGEKYLSVVELEFIDRKQEAIIETICRIFRYSKINCEKDYEKQLSDNLMPILLESYYVISQVPSGKGILDIIFLPKNKAYPTYVLKAKYKSKGTENELDDCCLIAFHQIWILKYHDKFVDETTDLIFIGVAVSSTSINCSIAPKEVFVKCECHKDNKDNPCQVIKEAHRLKRFMQV